MRACASSFKPVADKLYARVTLKLALADFRMLVAGVDAQTAAFDDFKALAKGASMAEVKAGGKYRQEGKSYVVQDGDIFLFKFNVTTAKK